jgi:hypothetical protein
MNFALTVITLGLCKVTKLIPYHLFVFDSLKLVLVAAVDGTVG